MSWIKDTFFGGAAKDAARVQQDALEKAMGIQRVASDQARNDIMQMFAPAYQDLVGGFVAAQDQIAQGRASTANIYNQATGQANQLLQQGTNASLAALLGRQPQSIQPPAQNIPTIQASEVNFGNQNKGGVITLPKQPAQPEMSTMGGGLRQPLTNVQTAGTGIRPTTDQLVGMRGGVMNDTAIRPDMNQVGGLRMPVGARFSATSQNQQQQPAQPQQTLPQELGAESQNIQAQQLGQLPVGNTAGIQMPDVSGIGLSGAESAILGGAAGAEQAISGSAQGAFDTIGQQFGQAAGQFDPYSQAGQQALNQEAALSGAMGGEAQQQAINQFMESPAQKFLRERAEQSLLRNASATGGLRGGSTLSALQEQAIGLSAQQQQQQLENLRSLAGRGQQAAGSIAGLQAQQGQLQSGIQQSAGTQLAGLRQGIGSQLGSLRMGVGQQVAGQLSGLGQAQAQNQLNLGSQLGNLDQTTMSNLANLLQNQGQQGFASRMQLAQILANLATGQGTNLSNLQSQIGTAAAGGITGGAAGAQQGIGNIGGLVSSFFGG